MKEHGLNLLHLMHDFIMENGVLHDDGTDKYTEMVEEYTYAFMEKHGIIHGVNDDSDNISIYVDGVNYQIATGTYVG